MIDLHAIADGLDRFNKKTKIAQITGGSTSAVGGVATITGLILAPFTMGTSLIVTAVGLGVAMAGWSYLCICWDIQYRQQLFGSQEG